MRGDQLGLLLWKNYVIRKRNPGLLALVLLWPVLVFLVLYAVRDNTEPEINPTCEFPARLMPQDNLLPFMQNFICTLGNPCESLSEYEEVPSYKSAQLGPLMRELQSLIKNETAMKATKALPKSIKFLRSMAEVLTRPGVKQIFEKGIRLGDLFNDHDGIRDLLKRELPTLTPALVNSVLNASIKMQYLVDAFGSSNMDGIICTPESLKQFLILPTNEDLLRVSEALCSLNSTVIPELFQLLAEQLDFTGLFNMVNLVMAKFSNYDIYTDLKQTAESILSLKMVDLYVPENLRLREWFPKIILLFKNVTFKDIDLSFINNAVDLLDPIFLEERDWAIARKAFLKLNSVLEMVRDLIHDKPVEKLAPNGVYKMTNDILENLNKSLHSREVESISEIMDTAWKVLQGGAKLTKVLLNDYEGDIELSAEVLDSLRNFFPKKIMNTVSHVISLSDIMIKAVHHIATLHQESSRRIWNITQKYSSIVRPLLGMSPTVYKTVVESFSHLDLVENFVEEVGTAGEIFCNRPMFGRIFNDSKKLGADYETISMVLCSEEGKRFLTEIYDSFDLKIFEILVKDMLSTFVHSAMEIPMPMTDRNLTTVVRSIKEFSAYMETPRTSEEPDWRSLTPNNAWAETFRNTSARGRLDILGIHLSIAKKEGGRSLSYITIKSSLEKMNFLAEKIIRVMQSEPIDWVKNLGEALPQMINTFYLTSSNRSKVLNILEVSNFTDTFCEAADSHGLIVYPKGSNENILKREICQFFKYIECGLLYGFEGPTSSPDTNPFSTSFNWTAFNERVVTIYTPIDSIIHEKYPDVNMTERQLLMDKFANAWTKNLTVRDGWELSIGLLCKLGDMIDHSIYGIRYLHPWENVRALARVFSHIFRTLQDRVNIVMNKNGTSQISLNSMPETGSLEEVILRNIEDGVNDIADMITLKLPNFSAIIDYKKRETSWPCVREQSVGEVLGIRNGTRKIIKEIERVACSPGIFIKEWRQLLSEEEVAEHPHEKPFNWTEGYKSFRHLVDNLIELTRASNIFTEGPKVTFEEIQNVFEKAKIFIDSKFTDKTIWNDILTDVDNKLNDLMGRTNNFTLTTNNILFESNNVDKLCTVSALAKYVGHVIHEMSTAALSILNEGPEIEALSVIGFGDKSPVKIVYTNLPALVATFVNGLSSSTMMKKLSLMSYNPYKGPTCADVFDWFAEYRSRISPEDYQTVKNCTCDSDPNNFNVLSDLILSETVIRGQPAISYPLYAGRSILKLYELGAAIKTATDNGVKIKPPFTAEYWNIFVKSLTWDLKQHQSIPRVVDDSPAEEFHLKVEFFSELLRHLAMSLKKIGEDEAEVDFHLWDLVEDSDARQFLKLVEAHPMESISLAATLAWADPTTGLPMSLLDFEKNICQRHSNLEFWNETKRMHFLKSVCSYDPRQLLKSITSQEYYDLINGSRKKVQRESSLSENLVNVIEASYNLSISRPRLAFKTNIFNITTWRNLDNTSLSIIHNTEQSWINYYYDKLNNDSEKFFSRAKNSTGYENVFPELQELYKAASKLDAADSVIQISSIVLDLASGGDVWSKIRAIYEVKPRMKMALSLVEDLPNFVITVVNSFFNSEITKDNLIPLITGDIKPCEVQKYLIEPKYMRRKGFLGSFSHLCQQTLEIHESDVLPIQSLNTHYMESIYPTQRNETLAMIHLRRLESIISRILSEGFKEFKTPTYWISFIAGNFKDFLSEYDAMEPHVLVNLTTRQVTRFFKTVLELNSDLSDSQRLYRSITEILQILNEHLSKHETYTSLVACSFKKLDFDKMRIVLLRDLNWITTFDKILGNRDVGTFRNNTLAALTAELEKTIYYLEEMTLWYFKTNETSQSSSCMESKFDKDRASKPTTYINLLRIALTLLYEHVSITDTAISHSKLRELGQMAEKTVPIWIPLKDIVKESDVNEIERLLDGSLTLINVNMLDVNETRNEADYYAILVSKRSKNFLQYSDTSADVLSIGEISRQLAKSLDPLIIRQRITKWREEATVNLFWLKEILRNLDVIAVEAGNLLDVASTIDFSGDVFETPRLYEDIMHLLREETLDKFFDGFNELFDRVEPFITDPVVKADTRTALNIFESMEIFKNLGLLNTKYVIKEMIPNWPILRSYLIGTVGLSENVTKALSQGKVDMLSVYVKERKTVSFKDTICSAEKLGEILEFESGKSTAGEISELLCEMSSEQAQNITIRLVKKLKFSTLLKDITSASVKNILSNANLNEKEGADIIKNLGFAAGLVPVLENAAADLLGQASSERLVAERTESSSSGEKMDFGRFLTSTGQMLCGKSVVEDTGKFFKVISGIEENGEEFDERELAHLPTDFCRDTYKEISRMGAGKILWTYVKPLLRGKILYTPRTSVIDSVMREANSTFADIGNFAVLIESFEKSISSLANLTELGESLTDLRQVLASDLMRMAIKSYSGPSLGINLENFDLGNLAWRMKKSRKLIDSIQMINKFMDCVLVDRMIGFATEKELELEASRLLKTNDFLAGVVFIDERTTGRTKRSYEHGLPDNITYKIRMDVDSVPSTSRLKNQFWTPGPDSSFVENLRYLRGFVQLQDSIDRALIKAKTQTQQEWKTVSQQMPYPCWKFLSFQSALYESQGLQVCFFFALMMCVGAAVRHIVWERESQNSMVMSVMGLKPWRNTFAWFITSMIEITLVAICIHIILITGKILPHSDPMLVLFLLLDYVFASVTFCYMVSTIFSSASLASVTTVIFFLLTYMPYIIVIAMEASVNLAVKLLICLNMSTSFCYGCLYAVRKEVQGTGLTWATMWDESSPGDSMSLGLVMVLIAFDGCLYAVIGFFVTRYTNAGKGFHGLRSISLWWADTRAFYGRPSYLAFENQVYFTNDVVVSSSSTHQESETDLTSLQTHDEKQIGVRFDDVRKVYKTDNGECVAVDDFSIKLMEGEVTTLLGRNGAGKTTIIKMLTGMEAPTSGEIWLPNNNTGKPNIGVCPQTNVLIGCLTAREHMMFYARLKQIKNDYDVERDIDAMLTSMELNGQEDELVCRLSGGTQRRLCVCLAFLGSPHLVILDEPGAGVDPAARRRIWRLIDKHRIGRTVLLSTHHLDEADMLSDTVVIMHKGRILCSGSPLSLKLNYGQGYKVTVSFPVQNSRLEKENDEDDSGVSSTALSALTSIVEDVIPNAILNDVAHSEVNIILPFQKEHGVSNDIAGAVKALEDNQEILGYSHFSVECDTMERVFLDMCANADGGQTYAKPKSLESLNSLKSTTLTIPTDDVELITDGTIEPPSYFRQGKALLKKRLWHFSRDWRAPLATLILPTLFVAVAMGFSLIRPPSDDQPPLVLTTDLYNTHPVYFYSIDSKRDQFHRRVSLQLHDRFGDDYAGAWQTSPNDTGTCDCLDGEQVCKGIPPPFEGLIQTAPGRPTLDWIVSTQQQYNEKRYGGWSLSHTGAKDETELFTVWYNNKGHHALPAYVNALNEAILRANGVSGHLTTINHPIKLSRDQLNRTSLLQHVADVGVALVLLIAFSLVGAQGAKELVRERLSEEKRILYLAGVRPLTYWTTALIWDLLVFAVSILLAVIVFEIFGLPAYVARDNLSSVCLLLFLFAWAVIPFTHLAEKLFDDSSLSNMVLFCLNTFIGVLSLATILIIDILGKSKTAENVREFLHQLLLIFPQYALGDGLVQITTNDIKANLLERFNMDTYKQPLSWELIGPHCLYLFLVGAVLYGINLVVECRAVPDFRKKKVAYENIEEDEDVAKERARVEKGLSNSVLKTVRLRKEYTSAYGRNVAVQDLSFGIQPGECFGLFGVNGAGKSTTFKMLTTEILPTAGQVILNERELGSGPLCSGDVGYCPQSDALDPFLTPHQSLTIHGEVAGLKNVSRAVEAALKHFDLIKYAHQRVASLSGGNKRKLAAAISVMVPSRIVLMDEATTGMDPASKDLVARAVKSIVKNQGSVLMTSHSVAECENICNRVGVLAKAGLKCIGSPQYLKHKYGEGYIVFLRFKGPTLLSDLLETTSRHLPGASIASRQVFAARLLVPRKRNVKLSTVFAKVKDLAEELNAVDYTLTQSSLDQVLVNFSEELDNEKFFENRMASESRLNSNSDAIHMDTMRRERFTALPVG